MWCSAWHVWCMSLLGAFKLHLEQHTCSSLSLSPTIAVHCGTEEKKCCGRSRSCYASCYVLDGMLCIISLTEQNGSLRGLLVCLFCAPYNNKQIVLLERPRTTFLYIFGSLCRLGAALCWYCVEFLYILWPSRASRCKSGGAFLIVDLLTLPATWRTEIQSHKLSISNAINESTFHHFSPFLSFVYLPKSLTMLVFNLILIKSL